MEPCIAETSEDEYGHALIYYTNLRKKGKK